MREPATSRAFEYIDATADVQKESSDLAVSAGVANLRVMYTDGKLSMPVSLSIQTSTGLHRGVHMSRLVRAAKAKGRGGFESWLRGICHEVNETQPGSVVTCALEMPFDDQFARVAIRTTEKGAATYEYRLTGMTACPCSKKMVGIGHMQRAEITLMSRGKKSSDPQSVLSRVSECFSAQPREELKRLEEAKMILAAQANPRFAEDLVRECVKRFPDALYVSARCFESIHVHDAVATWSSKPGWVPFV